MEEFEHEDLTPELKDHIKTAFTATLGFPPRPIQCLAVFLVAFLGLTTLLVSGTGTGKTAVMQITSILLGGITIVIVPLNGLGSDQKNRANAATNKIEAYHFDSIKNPKEQQRLCKYLLSDEVKGKSIILFASPQHLDNNIWAKLIHECINQEKITSLFVDEAHAVVMAGKTYRDEFLRLWKNLFQHLPSDTPICGMTATLTEPVLADLESILGIKFDRPLIWSDAMLKRRNINLILSYKSQTLTRIKQSVKKHLSIKTRHIFVYCNTAARSTGAVRECLVEVLAKEEIRGDVLVLNGRCGDDEKAYLIELLTMKKEEHPCYESKEHEYMMKYNPIIIILTNAADMGIDDDRCGLVAMDGVCGSMFQYAQRHGRAGRVPLPQDHSSVPYESLMVVTLGSFVYLATRNLKDSTPAQYTFKKERLEEVLQFAVLQNGCLYQKLEQFFGNPSNKKERKKAAAKTQGRGRAGRRSKRPTKKGRKEQDSNDVPEEEKQCCTGGEGIGAGKCSYCFPVRGEKRLVLDVHALVRELTLVVFLDSNEVSPTEMTVKLWPQRNRLFPNLIGGTQRRIIIADIELLVLQLIAGHLLSYSVKALPVKIKNKDILVMRVSPQMTTLGEGGSNCLAFNDKARWNGIGTYNIPDGM